MTRDLAIFHRDRGKLYTVEKHGLNFFGGIAIFGRCFGAQSHFLFGLAATNIPFKVVRQEPNPGPTDIRSGFIGKHSWIEHVDAVISIKATRVFAMKTL